MSYATPQEFIASFPPTESQELSNLDGFSTSSPNLDTQRIQFALDKAQGEINSYLAARGEVFPFIDVSGRLRDIEIIIARKNLNSYSWEENDPRYRDYKDVLEWLKNYSKGIVSLPKVDAGSPSSAVAVFIPQPNYFESRIFYGF
jgi:phage gp36-like protein